MISDEDIDKALDRIARTADGELLYRFFQKKLLGTLDEHAPTESALRTEHGERRFAQLLMIKMKQGIDESGGRTDLASRASERTVVFRGREPRATGAPRDARGFLRATDPELLALGRSGGGGGGDSGTGG